MKKLLLIALLTPFLAFADNLCLAGGYSIQSFTLTPIGTKLNGHVLSDNFRATHKADWHNVFASGNCLNVDAKDGDLDKHNADWAADLSKDITTVNLNSHLVLPDYTNDDNKPSSLFYAFIGDMVIWDNNVNQQYKCDNVIIGHGKVLLNSGVNSYYNWWIYSNADASGMSAKEYHHRLACTNTSTGASVVIQIEDIVSPPTNLPENKGGITV